MASSGNTHCYESGKRRGTIAPEWAVQSSTSRKQTAIGTLPNRKLTILTATTRGRPLAGKSMRSISGRTADYSRQADQ